MRRLVIPGLFGSGLVLVAAAAILWVRAGVPVEPPRQAPSTTESVQANPAQPPYERGKALFVAKGCITCHWHAQAGVSPSGSYRIGPDLTNIETVPYGGMPNDADFLREWLKDPKALKPSTPMPNLGLSDEEIGDLLAFLLTNELAAR